MQARLLCLLRSSSLRPHVLGCTPLSNKVQLMFPAARQVAKALPVCRALTEIQHDVKETREAIAEVCFDKILMLEQAGVSGSCHQPV